jgi:hypothetical protein
MSNWKRMRNECRCEECCFGWDIKLEDRQCSNFRKALDEHNESFNKYMALHHPGLIPPYEPVNVKWNTTPLNTTKTS